MGISTIPAASGGKTRFVSTLTSGTSWTVPSGVTYVNVTLRGGGGGGSGGLNGGSGNVFLYGAVGSGGQIVTSTLATTPGASITYGVGAGGTGTTSNGNTGGTTTFTGATSAIGGNGGQQVGSAGSAGSTSFGAANGGQAGGYGGGVTTAGGNGGNGSIDVEYWV